jgi:hypothetical protein
LLVVLVAAIGNAADLDLQTDDQNVVQGSEDYNDIVASVAYAIQNDGSVIATVTFPDAYDDVWAKFDSGSTTYTQCTPGTGNDWECTLASGTINGADEIDVIATKN